MTNTNIVERNLLPSDKIDGIYKFNLIHNKIKFYVLKEGICFQIEKPEDDYIIVNNKVYSLCNNIYLNIKTKELIITKDNWENCLNNINVNTKIINFENDILEIKVEFLFKDLIEDNIKYLSNKISKLEKDIKEKEVYIKELENIIKEKDKELSKFYIIKNLINIK